VSRKNKRKSKSPDVSRWQRLQLYVANAGKLAVFKYIGAIALTVAGTFLANLAWESWRAPVLSIEMAKALVASYRTVDAAGIHEYRAVVDLEMNCLAGLIAYEADVDSVLPASLNPTIPRMVYGVRIKNIGRSDLNDLRFTFRSSGTAFDVKATPQLSLVLGHEVDPSGGPTKIITVPSLAPSSEGIIIGTLAIPNGRVSFASDSSTVTLHPGDSDSTPGTNHLSFLGAKELHATPLTGISVNDLFKHQGALFGLDATYLPSDPIEVGTAGGTIFLRNLTSPSSCSTSTDAIATYGARVVQRETVASDGAKQPLGRWTIVGR
jgi:hypothetical protein